MAKQATTTTTRVAVSAAAGLVGAGLAAYYAYRKTQDAIDPEDYAARTDRILGTTPLIDGHNDLPFLLRLELHNQIYNEKTFPFREGPNIPSTLITSLKLMKCGS